MAWSICVLEDDPTFRSVLIDVLEDDDLYQVYPAPLPSDALRLAQKHQFDLVVADVRMDEMDGITCLEKLKATQPHLRSIVITGYADSDAPGRAIGIEADDYLHKPFSTVDFLNSVQQVLEAKKQQAFYAHLIKSVRPDTQADPIAEMRDRVYRSYYVSVRSGLLGLEQARSVWDRLESLEESDDSFSAADTRLQGYRRLLPQLMSPERYPAEELPGRIDPALFERFFQRLKAGRLSTQLIKMGSLLRKLDAVSLRQYPDLAAAYHRLWTEEALHRDAGAS